MDTVSIKEARRRLSHLVEAAERGQPTVITRRGKKVVRLVPLKETPLRGLPDLTEFRASIKVRGKGLTDTVLEGRKEERY